MKKPNFYTVLPATVRYDENLSDFEKIVMSEIVALANQTGYCYASNSYFAKVYNKSISTITRTISNLVKHGYIKIYIDKNFGNRRRIYIVLEKYFLMLKSDNAKKSIEHELRKNNFEIERSIVKNEFEGMGKSDEYNNTRYNTYLNKQDEVNIAELFNRIMMRSKRK